MKNFTLVELMFAIAILVLLISIGLVAGTKVLRNQTEKQRNAEIFQIETAIKQYKDRYGGLPAASSGEIDFAWRLSGWTANHDYNGDGQINDNDKTHPMRSMWIEGLNYDLEKIYDPYEEPYQIEIHNETFEVK